MNNLDAANMKKKEEYFANYESAKAAKTEKKPINSADFTINEQINKFEKTSFSKKEEKAIYGDAMSV